MKRYGILANPARHSLSPAMHNAAFKDLHMRAQYEVFEVQENDLPKFMKYVRNEPIHGLSVSLPYKEKIMQYLDKINKEALKIGSVNTVVNSQGFLYGFNTDYLASNKALFLDMKGRNVPIKDTVAVVIGAGGAARAVCYGLLKMDINVWVTNRTKEKADAIAIEFAEMFHNAEIHSSEWGKFGTGDILINATSVWTKNPKIRMQDLPYFCEREYVKEFKLIMDLCYKPLETPLIKMAKRLGKEFVTGDKMLLYQAVDQFELWTGKKPPIEVMRAALEAEF